MLLPLIDADHRYTTRPWATYALLVLLVVVFVPNYVADHANLRDGTRLLERALEYHADHPYLKLDGRLQRVLAVERGAAEGALAAPARGKAGSGKKPQFRALEQAELDGLSRAGFDTVERLSYWRWGLVPADLSPTGFIGHLFLHAGWLPLLANLLMLYLAGSYLEGRWGWWAVPSCYAASGLVAAVVFRVLHSGFPLPLVGGTAGAAGVVAAFVLTFGFEKLTARYWLGPDRDSTVAFPAVLLLAAWALREALSLVSTDVLTPAGLAGAVVYPAHAAGFCVGIVFGGALRFPAARRRAVRLAAAAARIKLPALPRLKKVSHREPQPGTSRNSLEERRGEAPPAAVTARFPEPPIVPRVRPERPETRPETAAHRSGPRRAPTARQAGPVAGTRGVAGGVADQLEFVPVVLLGVKDGLLGVELADGTQRTVPLSRVRGIGAASVYDGGLKPAYVLDLVLHAPGGVDAPGKVLRCQGDRFDPRRLVPSEPEPEGALLSLAVRLRIESGAAWLLGAKPTTLSSFASRAEHDAELLAALRRGPAEA